MFNDKYGLTKAVLDGRKTQTRRIACVDYINSPNYEIVIEGKDRDKVCLNEGNFIVAKSRYKIGEEVAVAQPYRVAACNADYNDKEIKEVVCSKGWKNKMFVKADLMPHHIRIFDIRVELLQEISEEDCLAEGIVDFESRINKAHFYSITDESATYGTAKKPYSLLIDKIAGKGTWASNPYVFVYEFELIK